MLAALGRMENHPDKQAGHLFSILLLTLFFTFEFVCTADLCERPSGKVMGSCFRCR